MTGVAVSLLDATMMLVALFFFFRDGDRIIGLVRDLIPMRPAYRDRILKTLYDTVQVVVQSSLVIALLQGIVAGLGYAFLGGISVSVFLAFLTAVASLVPVVGSALIWIPTAIYVLATAELWRGIALLLWGLFAVGSVDNIVRPLMIGGRVQVPTVLLLFALLGGVQVYGMLGIIVAPVVVAILIGFVEIYREHFGADGDGRRAAGSRLIGFTPRRRAGTWAGRARVADAPGPGLVHPPMTDSAKAHRKPAAPMRPEWSWVPSNASGIIVSISIARIPPAASAVVAACVSEEKSPKTA